VAVALLEEMDLWVEVVENGQIAVDKLTGPEREKYDAVLMDIQMPIMDGYQATRRIRAHEAQLNPPPEQREESDPSPNTRIPIIALTAHALKGEKEKCLAAGMDDYIAKPIDEMQLAQVLFKWMTPGAEITFDDKPHLLPADGRRQPPDPVSGLDIGAALEHLS
jgi:two-component system, sensor histidine kinase and response regulator